MHDITITISDDEGVALANWNENPDGARERSATP